MWKQGHQSPSNLEQWLRITVHLLSDIIACIKREGGKTDNGQKLQRFLACFVKQNRFICFIHGITLIISVSHSSNIGKITIKM